MPGRLENAIARIHDERRALVFVNHTRPTGYTIDHLKSNAMIMHVIRGFAAIRDANMRGDKSPARLARYQIAVLHTGPPFAPGVVVAAAGQYKFLCSRRQNNGRRMFYKLDPDSPGSKKYVVGELLSKFVITK